MIGATRKSLTTGALAILVILARPTTAAASEPAAHTAGKPIVEWVDDLESGDATREWRAVAGLAETGAPAAGQIVLALGHDRARVRYLAAMAAARIGPAAVLG